MYTERIVPKWSFQDRNTRRKMLRCGTGSHAIGRDHYFPESRGNVSWNGITMVHVPSRNVRRNIEKYWNFMCRKMCAFYVGKLLVVDK